MCIYIYMKKYIIMCIYVPGSVNHSLLPDVQRVLPLASPPPIRATACWPVTAGALRGGPWGKTELSWKQSYKQQGNHPF